jgi:hypothetical protein
MFLSTVICYSSLSRCFCWRMNGFLVNYVSCEGGKTRVLQHEMAYSTPQLSHITKIGRGGRLLGTLFWGFKNINFKKYFHSLFKKNLQSTTEKTINFEIYSIPAQRYPPSPRQMVWASSVCPRHILNSRQEAEGSRRRAWERPQAMAPRIHYG